MKRLTVLFVLALTGCGPLVPVKDMRTVSEEQKQIAFSLPIYNDSQISGRPYAILNVVEGISCKNKMWDSAATKTDAISQAKYWAKEQGADGIMNLQCDAPRGTTVTYNCWESVTCTAQAIKFKDQK